MALKQGNDSCGFFFCSAFSPIYRFVDENFGVGDVRLVGTTMFEDMDTITAETHVLTLKERNTWKLRRNELTPVIDLDNVLQSLVDGGKYQFTEDNIVQYSQMIP